MKAALMQEYHRPLELVERPVPEPVRHTDVLVRVGGAGVCATDLHAIDGLMGPAFFSGWGICFVRKHLDGGKCSGTPSAGAGAIACAADRRGVRSARSLTMC